MERELEPPSYRIIEVIQRANLIAASTTLDTLLDQMLDLFVTLTDFYGYEELVQIHDPPLIHEIEHHHVLHFAYRRHSNGEVESDFELDNAPGLAFARFIPGSFVILSAAKDLDT